MTDQENDRLLAILQSDLALAGLILVFAGFLISKADSYNSTVLGEKYRKLALWSGLPIMAAIGSAWACLFALEGWQSSITMLTYFKAVLALASLYIGVSGWVLKS